MASSGNSLANLIVRFIAETQPFLDGIKGMEDATSRTSEHIEGFGHELSSVLGEGFLEFAGAAGIATGAVELFKESLSEFASIQRATIALTALTGSAEDAEQSIERLRGMAISQGLDFQQLVTANQRMVAFGISAQQIPGLLQAAANAAAATNKDLDSVTTALDRIALSGNASSRILATLGLSAEDLGKAMGVTAEQASKAFKSLDEADRLQVLTEALQKYAGVSQQVAEGLSGQWQTFKNELAVLFEAIGADLAPLATVGLEVFSKLASGMKELIDVADSLAHFLAGPAAAIDNIYNKLGTWESATTAQIEKVKILSAGIDEHNKILGANQITIDKENMSVTQYIDAASKALSTTGDWTTASMGFGTVLADGTIKLGRWVTGASLVKASQEELNKAFEASRTAYQSVVEAFDGGMATAGQVNAAYALMVANANAAGKALKALGTDSAALGVALQALGLKPVADQIAGLENAMTVVRQAFDKGTISTEQYDAAVKKFVSSMDSLQAKFQATTGPIDIFSRDAAEKLDIALGPAMEEQFLKSADAIEAFGIAAGRSSTGILSMDSALRSIGQQTFTDLANRVRYLTDAFDAFSAAAAVGVPGAAQKAAEALLLLDRAEAQLDGDRLDEARLGIPDLVTLQKQLGVDTDAYKRLSSDGVLNTSQDIQAQIRILNDQIAVLKQTGGNYYDLQLKVDALSRSLRVTPTLWQGVKASMIDVKNVMTQDLQTGIDNLIAGTGTLAQAFKKMGLDMVDVIVNNIIKNGIQLLIDKLSSVGGLLGQIGGLLGGNKSGGGLFGGGGLGTVFSLGGGANIGAPGTGNIGDVLSTGDTLAGLGTSATSAAGTATSAASGILGGIVGPIAAVGTLISSIIGNFQAARSETTLNAIEGNTRKSAIFLGEAEGASGIVQFTKQAAQRLQSIESRISDTLHPDLVAVRAAVSLFSSVVNGPAGSNGKTVDVGAILNGVVDVTEAYNQGLIHAIQVLDDNLGGKIDQFSNYVNQRLINIERDINKMANPPFWKQILGAGLLFGSGIGGSGGGGVGGLLSGLTGGIASGIGSAISAAFSGGEKDRLNIIANNIAVMNPDLHNTMLAGLTLSNDFKAFSDTGFSGWFRDHLLGVEEWQDAVLLNLGNLIDLIKSPVISAAQTLVNGGTITIHIHESSDPQSTAQELMGLLKNYSPVFQG